MSRVFARVNDVQGVDRVMEIIQEFENIEDEWHPDVVATLVEVTDVIPQPQVGWVYDNGEFAPYEPVLTPADQMNMAMLNGCQVQSTSKSTLNAIYFPNGPLWQQMTNEVLYIVSFNKFSGGLSQMNWQTKTGTVTFTDKNDFKNVVQGIGDWLTGWNMYMSGDAAAPPPDVVTVA